MIVLHHYDAKITLAPKSVSILKGLYKSMLAIRNWFYQDITCDKPKGMPCSNRQWNRNSAFIMSQYEKRGYQDVSSGRVND